MNFVVEKLVFNVGIKSFWYTNLFYSLKFCIMAQSTKKQRQKQVKVVIRSADLKVRNNHATSLYHKSGYVWFYEK